MYPPFRRPGRLSNLRREHKDHKDHKGTQREEGQKKNIHQPSVGFL
jgi:hypothetical protein